MLFIKKKIYLNFFFVWLEDWRKRVLENLECFELYTQEDAVVEVALKGRIREKR